MPLTTDIVNLTQSLRRADLDHFRQFGPQVQAEQLTRLLRHLSQTEYGRKCGINGSESIESFQAKVPVVTYEQFSENIARTKSGEQGIIWDSKIDLFAKSSGTTDAKSKYIPVSREGLKDSHLRGPRDVLTIFVHNNPESKIFEGKILTLGGSKRIEREGEGAFTGDLSAILIDNTPAFAELFRLPSRSTALIADFDRKVEMICKECTDSNVTAFAGVPSWNLVLMRRILDYTGKKNLLDVWPNLELFMHGGVSFAPYRDQYRNIIPSDTMKYMDTYNASEGFFSIADDPSKDDMLLMLDYGEFYEFLPVEHLGDTSKAIPLEDVRCGVNYALIISSSNGLWRYMIGDTVIFTSTAPYRIKISGRTKHYINCFGEEVVVENVEGAITAACKATGAMIAEYTVAPIYMDSDKAKGAHQWIVEFSTEPSDAELFMNIIDDHLRSINSDYDAKRYKDTTLTKPQLITMKRGGFMSWLAQADKLGGQNKVPRLFNTRQYADQLIESQAK